MEQPVGKLPARTGESPVPPRPRPLIRLLLVQLCFYFRAGTFGEVDGLGPGLEAFGLDGERQVFIGQKRLGTPAAILLLFEIDVARVAVDPVGRLGEWFAVVRIVYPALERRDIRGFSWLTPAKKE